MSFPPRPPYGMPGMMPQGFPFTPMGMNMMPMQMVSPPVTTMMRPVGIGPPPMMHPQQQKQMKKLIPQNIAMDRHEEKPPVTTVFVGNISERAPDMMIKQMLQRCGNVLSWKRVQGASGKLQAFGFCEYECPEATLRCIRLLNEWRISDKKLVVKVDAKTKTLLDEYRKKKKAKEQSNSVKSEPAKEGEKEKDKETADVKENGEKGDKAEKEEGEESSVENEDELDEDSKREDRVAQAGLEAIMREYAFELAKEPPSAKPVVEKETTSSTKTVVKKKDDKEPRDIGFEDMDLEEDKRDIINREIRMFRDMHKDDEEDDHEKERRSRELRMEEARRRRERERDKDRERAKIREREREQRERERERERELERERTRSRSRSSSRGRSRRRRSPSRERSRDSSRDKKKEREIEEEEEAYEQRKLEKKLREKEAAYQERLKNWEQRERKKAREYEKEKEREDERKAEESREARRLKEFLEDYDDLRDDPKFYKGSPLGRRLKEREKEKEADMRDRQREKEELEELKRKLLDQGHPDPEAELARLKKQRDEHLQPRLQLIEAEQTASSEPSEKELKEESEEEKSVKPKLTPVSRSRSPVPPRSKSPVPPRSRSPVPPRSRSPVPPRSRSPVPPRSRSVSEANTPLTDDEVSRLSAPGHFMEEESVSQQGFGPTVKEESVKMGFGSLKLGAVSSPSESGSTVTTPAPSTGSGVSLGATFTMGGGKKKKLTVGDVFNQDDDEDHPENKRRKLIPLDYDDDKGGGSGDDKKKPTTAEEKRQKIKVLIESIPTAKDELFSYPLDWSIVDQTLMDKRIKPWVTKKIVEYIGEEEPTLTDFICQKVVAHSPPQSIQNDVAMLDNILYLPRWMHLYLCYERHAGKLTARMHIECSEVLTLRDLQELKLSDGTADSYLSSHMYSEIFILDGMSAESFNFFLPNASTGRGSRGVCGEDVETLGV